jgi:hypothetical protein
MKNTIIAIMLAAAGVAWGDTVELPLNCAGIYDVNSPPWTMDFDLGVTFSKISHVYIDWSGEITAGLAVSDDDPCNPFPLRAGISGSLGSNPWPRLTDVMGGEETYPEPEIFDIISHFSISQLSSWSDLLDGQGTIRILYEELSFVGDSEWPGAEYIEHGSVMLNDAALIIDGTIIPEPATVLFLSFGAGLMLRTRRSRTSR